MKRIILGLIIILVNFQNATTQTTVRYAIKNLDSNQAYPDMGVAFFDDDFIIYSGQVKKPLELHSRKRRGSVNKKGGFLPQNLDFYFTPIDKNGNFINSQKLNNVINSRYDDYGLTFSKDQSIVYFSREMVKKDSEEMHMELFQAKVISPGSWVNIKKLSFNHSKYSVGYPCLSEDDKTLYFVSNKEGDFNIYKVAVESDGEVGVPIKLSSSINSSSNETTPFILNNTLYFSSDRSGGLGGFDIYSIDLNTPNSKISRIQEPINSTFDDTNFIKKNSNEGFFVSNRPGGKGKEDIYFFKSTTNNFESDTAVSNREEIIIKGKAKDIFNDEEAILAKKSKNLRVQDKTITIKKIIKTDSIVMVKNESVYDFQRRNSYDRQVLSGTKEIEIKKGVVKDEYTKCQMEFDKLKNIYFDYSESYIRADAAIELDKVIRVLRLCPKIVLQASSHTDSRASHSYNLKLSQDRANSVVRYILRNGNFSPDRIVSKGYGEERLANKCSDGVKCTESEHQLNRRTHFEIYNY